MTKPTKAAPQPNGSCVWAHGDDAMGTYHDHEWGVPIYNSRSLFEKLLLDGLQAGLSWRTILYRRAGLRAALDNFSPEAMARYDAARVAKLLGDPRLIRNRAKITALIGNARAYLSMQAGGEEMGPWLWQFVDHVPRQHSRPQGALSPTQSPTSEAMSRALKARGFAFCGPTICYAFMQAVGMLNDHDAGCPRHAELGGPGAK